MVQRLILLLCFIPCLFFALEQKKILMASDIFEEVSLPNGMVVYLAKAKDDGDDISIRFIAKGGYADVEISERASFELAPLAAMESQLLGLSGDPLFALLWKNDIEFHPRVSPFSRTINGVIEIDQEDINEDKERKISLFLQLLKDYFTSGQINKEGFSLTKERSLESLKGVQDDVETRFETLYKSHNTQNHSDFAPLTYEMYQDASLQKAADLFKDGFKDPSEFTGWIVGPFDPIVVRKLVEKELGAIPPATNKFREIKQRTSTFPDGITEKTVSLQSRQEGLTRITFPFEMKIDAKLAPSFEIALQVLEKELKETIRKRKTMSFGVDVAFEFPLYPDVSTLWVSVQFCCAPEKTKTLVSLAIGVLKKLQEEGVTDKSLQEVITLHRNNEEYWLQDGSFLLEKGLTAHLLGWDFDKFSFDPSIYSSVKKEVVDEILRAIPLQNYSVVSIRSKEPVW